MIPLDTFSADLAPCYLITNLLRLQERVVKCIHFKLPNLTVLQEDEKSVIFFFFYSFSVLEKLMSTWVTRKSGFWRAVLLAAFPQGQATGFRCFLSGEKIITGRLWEVGPPVSALLCYEYGTDGAKSICSVGTKTLTTQLSLLKTLLSSFIPSAFCAPLWGFDFIEKGTS